MKLCPQCDFIYENDQIVCDMDGAALVYDPAPFPAGRDAARDAAVISSANRQWWRFAATAVVGVGLGIALLYQISVQPTTPRSRRDSSVQVTNNSPEHVGSDSALPVIDESDPANLDLTQPVPLAPLIDVTPAPSPAVTRKYSSESQLSLPSLSTYSPQKLKPTPKANSGTSAAVKSSPAPARSPAAQIKKPAPAIANPKASHQEKGSSIGSFLKKTGRIFKKPFKL